LQEKKHPVGMFGGMKFSMGWWEDAHRMVEMDIEEIFSNFFMAYCENTGKKESLRYVVTSTLREGRWNNPHSHPGNAMDITLRWNGDYAQIKEYNQLFEAILFCWPFRAGIDNTWGNIHIHLDLGESRPEGQDLPYFFKEEDGKWLKGVKSITDIL